MVVVPATDLDRAVSASHAREDEVNIIRGQLSLVDLMGLRDRIDALGMGR